MKTYPEILKIVGAFNKASRLIKNLDSKLDCDGLKFEGAYLIDGCSERKGHLYKKGIRLDNSGIVDDDYYCDQHTGYCEDDFYGTVYFKTKTPGQFIAVPFEL